MCIGDIRFAPDRAAFWTIAVLLVGTLFLLVACGSAAEDPTLVPAQQQQSEGAPAQPDQEAPADPAPTSEQQPEAPEPSPPIAEEIVLPPGFAAFRWAEGINQPTALAFSPDGRLFVAERGGRLWTFRDTDANGAADEQTLFAEGFNELLGFAIQDDTNIYLSDRGRISLAEDLDADGVADQIRPLVQDLPNGRHQNNSIALGPDGRLYITLGSTCNDCIEPSELSASILTLNLETSELEIYATGLRNPYDLVFTPLGELWATDNGSDPPCATPDELNRVLPQTHYGWPYCVEESAPFIGEQDFDLDLGLHTSADGIAWFASPIFPPEFSGGFYIALYGRTPAIRPLAGAYSSPSGRWTGASPSAISPLALNIRWM